MKTPDLRQNIHVFPDQIIRRAGKLIRKIFPPSLIRSEQGRSLPAALIALAVGSLLLTPFLSFVSSRSLGTTAAAETFQEQYAADAGIEFGIWTLLNDPTTKAQVDAAGGTPVSISFPETINGQNPSLTITALATGLNWLQDPPADPPRSVGPGGALEYDGGNNLYILIGDGDNRFYRYNTVSDNWSQLTRIPYVSVIHSPPGPPDISFLSVDTGSDLVYTGTGNNDLYALVKGYPLFGPDADYLYRYSIDNPGWQNVTSTPDELEAGACLVFDGSSSLYIFQGESSTFWRFSGSGWQTLQNAPGQVGAGAALVYTGGSYLYAFPGGGSSEFWRYEIGSGSPWTVLSDQPGGALPGPVTAGGSLTYDGIDAIYALAGGSQAVWRYTISSNTWTSLVDAPANVGSGGDLALIDDSNGYVLRGNNQDDYWRFQLESTRYDINAQAGNTAIHTGVELDNGNPTILFWDIE